METNWRIDLPKKRKYKLKQNNAEYILKCVFRDRIYSMLCIQIYIIAIHIINIIYNLMVKPIIIYSCVKEILDINVGFSDSIKNGITYYIT